MNNLVAVKHRLPPGARNAVNIAADLATNLTDLGRATMELGKINPMNFRGTHRWNDDEYPPNAMNCGGRCTSEGTGRFPQRVEFAANVEVEMV